VVVRLVLGRGSELSHGDIVDSSGQVFARFVIWEALVPAIRAWLEREDRE